MSKPIANSMLVIFPYLHNGAWVFDDAAVGLVREPFISGIPEMINRLVADIPNAGEGFRLIFSARPFPGYSTKAARRREEYGGYWYYSEEYDSEGWLCPALFKYFAEAPEEIYVRAEPM
jgi:hypothetical protein